MSVHTVPRIRATEALMGTLSPDDLAEQTGTPALFGSFGDVGRFIGKNAVLIFAPWLFVFWVIARFAGL